MKGRKPDALAVRRGASTADISSPSPSLVGQGALVKPESVSKTPILSDIWDNTVGSGISFRASDSPLIEQYVFNIAMVYESQRHLMDEDGTMHLTVEEEDAFGGIRIKENPYLKIRDNAMKTAMKLEQDLGLSPMARARLGLTQGMSANVQINIAKQIDAALGGGM